MSERYFKKKRRRNKLFSPRFIRASRIIDRNFCEFLDFNISEHAANVISPNYYLTTSILDFLVSSSSPVKVEFLHASPYLRRDIAAQFRGLRVFVRELIQTIVHHRFYNLVHLIDLERTLRLHTISVPILRRLKRITFVKITLVIF